LTGPDSRRRERPAGRAEPIGQILERLFRSKTFSREPSALGELRSRWTEILGEDLAEHMRPDRIRGHTLWIQVGSPPLFFEMKNFGKERLLSRLEDVLPGRFRDVKFFQ
jgi:hypothetical protein